MPRRAKHTLGSSWRGTAGPVRPPLARQASDRWQRYHPSGQQPEVLSKWQEQGDKNALLGGLWGVNSGVYLGPPFLGNVGAPRSGGYRMLTHNHLTVVSARWCYTPPCQDALGVCSSWVSACRPLEVPPLANCTPAARFCEADGSRRKAHDLDDSRAARGFCPACRGVQPVPAPWSAHSSTRPHCRDQQPRGCGYAMRSVWRLTRRYIVWPRNIFD